MILIHLSEATNNNPKYTNSLLAYNYQDDILINIIFNSDLNRDIQHS